MKVTRIYTGDDDRSHFEELDLPLRLTEVGAMSSAIPIESMFLRSTAETADTADQDGEAADQGGTDGEPDPTPKTSVWSYHVAPRRQFAIHLIGSTEIEVGDGTARTFGPGDLLLADDLTGQGHISREVDGPRLQVFAVLGSDVDLDRWRLDA